MKHLLIISALLALSACGGQPIFTPTIVKEPIATSCSVDIPTTPDWNVNKLTSASSIVDKLKAVLADRELNRSYDAQLLAALQACT